jgi:hypothetical protein
MECEILTMPKVGIRYARKADFPRDSDKLKFYTLRELRKHKIIFERVTLIATIPDSLIPRLENDFHNTIIQLEDPDINELLYKKACETLITLFDQFIENPTSDYFLQLLESMDLTSIDDVKKLMREKV